jgi:hypothetical protein
VNDRAQAIAGSIVGMAFALALWRWLAHIIPVNPTAGTSERLGVACASLIPAVCVLNAIIIAQMGWRAGTGALDPLAGQDDTRMQVNQRVLTNTVEQLAGFVPAMLAVAAGVSPGWMPFVVAAGVVFAVARLFFWGGYMLGPVLRAPGMAATFAVNLATLGAAIWVWWP